jgi:hypothetical protein
MWIGVAKMALPSDVPEFEQLMALTGVVRDAVANPVAATETETQRAGGELWQLRRRLDAECPLDQTARERRFTALGEALGEIYAAETSAVARLAEIRLPT